MSVSSDVNAETAEQFNTYMKRYPELYQSLASCVQEHLSSQTPVILDLGAGTGLLTLELQLRYPTATLLGLDPLRTMLRLAKDNTRETSSSAVHWLQGVSEALPLKSGMVEGVVTRFSLPYWNQPEKSFQEINRALQPGGVVILQGLNKDYPRWKLALLRLLMRLRTAPKNVITYHLDAYKIAHTRAWVEDLFTSTGFRLLLSSGKPWDWQFLIIAQKTQG